MRKPRVAFTTLGCKVNQYETFAMSGRFAGAGFDIVGPEEAAEVYIVNSCAVTASGERQSRQALRRLRRNAPKALLVLCGCFPQAFPGQAAGLAEADIVMGTADRAGVLDAVLRRLGTEDGHSRPVTPEGAGGGRIVDIAPHAAGEPFEPMQAAMPASRTRAFVKIEDGCERMCSYCIIPAARGPVRSKPMAELRAELAALGAAGYREAVLVGINLGCYGLEQGLALTDAIAAACEAPGIARVRLGSLEPELFLPPRADGLARWASFSKLCGQFHLSLQSGCDKTLARMNRPYTAAQYAGIAARLRAAFPGCALTTDIMVGFPGETDAEYAESEAFVRETGFARAHVFVYSPRPGTPAAIMPQQVEPAVAARRAKRMAAAAAEGRDAFLRGLAGTVRPVLFEARGADGLWQGYTPCYATVKAPSAADLGGEILPVLLGEAHGEYIDGRVMVE